ncbi:hypothetical protein ACF1DY_23720 [Streptomyces albus]
MTGPDAGAAARRHRTAAGTVFTVVAACAPVPENEGAGSAVP